MDRNNVGVVFLFSIICLLPMFTVLSRDTARLYQYASVVSLSAVLILEPERIRGIFPNFYYAGVERLMAWRNGILVPTKGLMIILLLTLSPILYGSLIERAITKSVLYFVITCIITVFKAIMDLFSFM